MNFYFPSGEKGYYLRVSMIRTEAMHVGMFTLVLTADSQHFCKSTKLSVLNLIEQRELARET